MTGRISPIVEKNLAKPLKYLANGASLDLQINGFSFRSRNNELKTVDFSNPNLSEDDVREAALAVYLSGTTFFLATIVTSEEETLIRNAKTITSVMLEDIGKGILGIHFEGPSIDVECKGAHKEEIIKTNPPTISFWESIYNACNYPDGSKNNSMVMVTMSPNYETSAETIRWLTDRKVVVSLGHFRAKDWSLIKKALEAGATGLTHIGNAWSKNPEDYGPKKISYPTLMCKEGIYPMFIGDFIHTDEEFLSEYLEQILRTGDAYFNTRKRAVLVSDLSPLAGAPEGTEGPDIFHGLSTTPIVRLTDGELRTEDLTGSCHTLSHQALKLADARFSFLNPDKIIAMTYKNPFELIIKNLLHREWRPDVNHLRRCRAHDISDWQKLILSKNKPESGSARVKRIHSNWAQNGFSIPSVDAWLESIRT